MEDRDVRTLQLRRAHAAWHTEDELLVSLERPGGFLMEPSDARRFFREAVGVQHERRHAPEGYATMMVVAKSPHAGSERSLVDLAARILAFRGSIVAVTRFTAKDAGNIAHSLYPDVWANFARPPVGETVWKRLDQVFNRPEFAKIMGDPYRPSMVKEGERVCRENGLTLQVFATLWENGRRPLLRSDAVGQYGEEAARHILGDRGELDWYRCSLPIGIQKLASSLMAFGMRHESVYDGEPTIVLNGQFALLSDRFVYADHGAVVMEVALPPDRSVVDFRRLLIGHSDVPSACRPGSVRRDAADGWFVTDDPSAVTPWANVVHASDGYLAGSVERHMLTPGRGPTLIDRELLASGYSGYEIEQILLKDPLILHQALEERLTAITKGLRLGDCISTLGELFPAESVVAGGRLGGSALQSLLSVACSADPPSHLDVAVPMAGSRIPENVPLRTLLHQTTVPLGDEAVRGGRVAVAVPLAGTGGRFGGYEVSEDSITRQKPLIPLFDVAGSRVSALDVRAAHVRSLGQHFGAEVPLFLSFNHHTESAVRAWARDNSDLEVDVGQVPEFYRIRECGDGRKGYGTQWEALSNVLRDGAGRPILKPLGSLGLFWALSGSGVMSKWAGNGVEYVVAANADDVGFRVDSAAIGLLERDASLDAVVMVVPLEKCSDVRADFVKGGLLRDRTGSAGRNRYIEENAAPGPRGTEFLNTNQIYLRLSSIETALDALRNGDRNYEIPVYFESKQSSVDGRQVKAWHTYQPYCDILRLFKNVDAVVMDRQPSPTQCGGFSPLKTLADVEVGQRTLDQISSRGFPDHDESST